MNKTAAHSPVQADQATTPKNPPDAAPYAVLTFEVCQLLANLANPASGGKLNPAEHLQAATALNTARAEAVERAKTLPRDSAQKATVLAKALAAAVATLELVQTAA